MNDTSSSAVNEAPIPHTSDDPLKGVLYGFAAFALFSFSDASVKMLKGALSPYEAAFVGALFAIVAMRPLLQDGDRWTDVFTTNNRKLWILRFLAYPIGIIASVTAFTKLPMAEAFCLIFLQPAFVTLMSGFWLKEPIRRKDWLAVLLGFIGVLIVLRPGFRELSIGHLGAILAGLSGSISMVTFRASANEKRISLFGSGILGGIVVCGIAAIPTLRFPSPLEWGLLAAYGLLAAWANLLMMSAARFAQAVHVGPTQYSQMLWAILLGYLFFGDTVDLPMIVGIVFIVASGLMKLVQPRKIG